MTLNEDALKAAKHAWSFDGTVEQVIKAYLAALPQQRDPHEWPDVQEAVIKKLDLVSRDAVVKLEQQLSERDAEIERLKAEWQKWDETAKFLYACVKRTEAKLVEAERLLPATPKEFYSRVNEIKAFLARRMEQHKETP